MAGFGWMRDERGQAAVEAAFVLPVMMLALLLLLQPGIVLYDRMVMQGAAVEGCRYLTTCSDAGGGGHAGCEEYVRRRLAAVPQHDLFHVHGAGGCSWRIELSGGETSSEVGVAITTELKPLPLLDAGAVLLGLANGNGNLELRVETRLATQPAWVSGSESGIDPAAWIGAWT